MVSEKSSYEGLDAVAIVGFAGRFPGAESADVFWRNLLEGKESITKLDDQELAAAGVNAETLKHPQYIKAGAFIEGVDQFDAGFFGYNPREAEYADPQQRHLLECAWEAFEHAGYDIERFEAPVGVFVGGAMSTYLVHMVERDSAAAPLDRFAALLGNDKDSLSTRISYLLNLKGPSYSIQTHCSSSLVAVHTACQSLLDGECKMALAGGITIRVPHRTGYYYQPGSINSPDGHCRPFDANAQGTVFGNGAGLVVLKRLEDALVDKDTIYAVIRGSAVNNDGGVKAGYTAPSVDGQASVVSEAMVVAGVDPEDIDYVEAHGTGTALGDPTEMAALKKAFAGTKRTTPHFVGSCKSNIGHLDTASGIAGLIKLTQMLYYKRLVPTLNFKTPNPEVDFFNSPFRVISEGNEWTAREGRKRFGSVSSFGVGGTNAHMVLMEGVDAPPNSIDETYHLIPVSARSETALSNACVRLEDAIKDSQMRLKDLAYTLQEGRKAFPYRRVAVVDRISGLGKAIGRDSESALSGHCDGVSPKVVFLFSGQGSQHVQMGRELYTGEVAFKEALDQCCSILEREGIDLLSHLYPKEGEGDLDASSEALACTGIAQPALFAIEYSLAKLWMSWGVKPAAFVGHSLGELVGACLAGVLTLEEALPLVAYRGRVMSDCERGAMVAVDLSIKETEPLVGGGVVIAASNGPRATVVSGTFEAIEAFTRKLSLSGVGFKPVKTSHAFHSAMMDGAATAFAKRVGDLTLSVNEVPLYSNVTGKLIHKDQVTNPAYWGRQLRECVLFSENLENAIETGYRLFLEIGPGQTLSSLARRQTSFDATCRSIASMPHPKSDKDGRVHLLESLGRLWIAGVSIDWNAHHGIDDTQRTALPTYPFERSRYWYEGRALNGIKAIGIGKRENVKDWLYTPTWRRWKAFDYLKCTAQPSSKWLIFLDSYGFAETFARWIEKDGSAVIRVNVGSSFIKVSEGEFEIRSTNSEDYEKLLGSIGGRSQIDKIAHFWNLGGIETSEIDEGGFLSIFHLGQQLCRLGEGNTLKLCVFGNQLFDPLEGEDIEPLKSGVLGLTRVLPKESRSISCHAVDLGWRKGDAITESLIHQMYRICEISDSDQKYPVVAFRDGDVWLEEFESLSELHSDDSHSLSLCGSGESVLIVGGLGGIGLEIAKAIAAEQTSNIAILTRSGLPDRSEWSALERLTPKQRIQVETVLELERSGANVMVQAADVADLSALRPAIETFEKVLGPIRSVIHAAGVSGGGMLALRKVKEIDRVMRSKVDGMYSLSQIIDFKKLRRVALCSSFSSFLGEYAQSDYCAANCILDAWARRLKSQGVCAVSINWDVWSEAGMSLVTGVPGNIVDKMRQENALKYGMTNVEGIEVFRKALDFGLPQVVVSTRPLSEWKDESKAIEEQLASQCDSTSEPPQMHQRPNCSTQYVGPKGEIEESITRVWQAMLGFQMIGVNDDFLELGGHSLLATQVLNKISQDYPSVELSLPDLFTSPTVRGLATLIERQLARGSVSCKPLHESLLALSEEARTRHLTEYVNDLWERLLGNGESVAFESGASVASSVAEKSASELIWELKRDLKLVFYPHEVARLGDASELARLVVREFNRKVNPDWVKSVDFQSTLSDCLPSYPTIAASSGLRNPSAIFLHSAPRSGSTLLRVLLAGHPKLFSPPELGLLASRTLGEWKSRLLSSFSSQGLVAAFASFKGRSVEDARELVEDLERRDVSVKEVYRMIQTEAGERSLIDKTPLYGLSLEVLRRSELLFENPKYIHLIRHPRAVIDSFARNRFDRIFTSDLVDPYRFAEDMWTECETNLGHFFDEVGPDRVFQLSFENLVTDVETTMRSLADFLEIEFDPALIDPYEGDRMAGGLGDPDILNHSKVDSALAESWKDLRLPWPLRERSIAIAKRYGYPFVSDAPRSLEDIDGMSEEELDRLLAQLG